MCAGLCMCVHARELLERTQGNSHGFSLRDRGGDIEGRRHDRIYISRREGRLIVAKNIDWGRLKVAYVTGKQSYKSLAKKYGIQPTAISRRGKDEEWPRLRREYREKAAARAIEKEVGNEAERLSKLINATDSMEDVVVKLFEDAKQFYRHIVINGDKTEENIFDKVDTKAIKDLTGALKDLSFVHRNLHGIPTQAEREAQRIAAARLEMDRKKAQLDENADKNISVELNGAGVYAE